MRKQKPVHKYSQLSALAGAGVISLFALVGCGGSSESPTSSSEQSSSSASETSSNERTPDSASTSSDEATDEAVSDDTSSASSSSAAPAGKPAALTPPGTKLKFGQPANTHANTGSDPKDAKYKEGTYTTTVTKVVAGAASDLSAFKEAAKYAGQIPYYVYTESKLTSLSKPTAGLSEPNVDAQLKDGTDAQELIVFGSFDKCKSTRFETTGKGDSLSYQVGSTAVKCSVFLAPKGDQITSVSYNDSRFSYAKYGDNEYRDNPIVWSK